MERDTNSRSEGGSTNQPGGVEKVNQIETETSGSGVKRVKLKASRKLRKDAKNRLFVKKEYAAVVPTEDDLKKHFQTAKNADKIAKKATKVTAQACKVAANNLVTVKAYTAAANALKKAIAKKA